MGTENEKNRIDLVVMTGSVPFITAGLFLEDQSDVTLISGALSGMSTLFQEMLQQGELRHSELYNAHIYVRHLSQINDSSFPINPELKQNAQMRVALIVRAGELSREEEIALSELCYSIMVKICDNPTLAKKLLKGNLEGYTPSNNETLEILVEAITDYRKRAKKSIFYEKSNFIQEKERFIAYPVNNSLLEGRIEQFSEKLINDYYPDYFPKVAFKNYFGKNEFWNAIQKLKTEFNALYSDKQYKEKISSDLFHFILKGGLLPLICYSGSMSERINTYFDQDLIIVLDKFLKHLLRTRGPVGISFNSVIQNISKLLNDDNRKLGWHFIKFFLEKISDVPFELPYLKQLCKILETFDFSSAFLTSILSLKQKALVPNEYIEEFVTIINCNLSKPVEVETSTSRDSLFQLHSSDPLQQKLKTSSSNIKSIPPINSSLINFYQQKDNLQNEIKKYLKNREVDLTVEEKIPLSPNESDFLQQKLSETMNQIDSQLEKSSLSILVKSEINTLHQLISKDEFEKSHQLIVNLIESFDTLEVPNNQFIELLLQSKVILQKITTVYRIPTNLKSGKKIKPIPRKNNLTKVFESSMQEIDELISYDSYTLAIEKMENSNLFEKKMLTIFIEKINNLNSLKEISNSEQKEATIESSSKPQKNITQSHIDLPKSTPESMRLNENILILAISDTFNWVHDQIFGAFFLTKNLPGNTNTGQFFANISESLTIEIGFIFDIIQSFTGPRTWSIGQLERLITAIENKIRNHNFDQKVKYVKEENLSIDLQNGNDQIKKIAERILEILTQIETDAVLNKITLENKKPYLEIGFLGRVQENSIPQVKKLLAELKIINRNLSNKELEQFSKNTSINFKEFTSNITSVQLIAEPLPTKETNFNKNIKENINQFKRLNLDLSNAIKTIFRVSLELPIKYDFSIIEEIVTNPTFFILFYLLNGALEETNDVRRKRIEFIKTSYQFRMEILNLVGEWLLNNKPLRIFSSIPLFRFKDEEENYYSKFSPINLININEELNRSFLTTEENSIVSIIGRKYPFKPFNNEKPTTLTELIISDSFRRAYESLKGELEKVMLLGKKIHSGLPNLLEEIMKSYNIISNGFSFKKNQ